MTGRMSYGAMRRQFLWATEEAPLGSGDVPTSPIYRASFGRVGKVFKSSYSGVLSAGIGKAYATYGRRKRRQ